MEILGLKSQFFLPRRIFDTPVKDDPKLEFQTPLARVSELRSVTLLPVLVKPEVLF